ncbi:MAG: membrane protein insertion efficiency factor YidD [Acetobacteraceae bacterium]
MSPAAHALRVPIIAYQWTIRPLLGPSCRFCPNCSDYALQALAQHGAARGSLLAAWRILRCNPWNPGGFDPVPPPDPSRKGARQG